MLTSKLTKDFIALLLNILAVLMVLLFFAVRTVASIEPRQWNKTEFNTKSERKEIIFAEEKITWDEYLDKTSKPLDTELTEDNCIKNKNDNSLTCF